VRGGGEEREEGGRGGEKKWVGEGLSKEYGGGGNE